MSFAKFAGYFVICLIILFLIWFAFVSLSGKYKRGKAAYIQADGNPLEGKKQTK